MPPNSSITGRIRERGEKALPKDQRRDIPTCF
jgi:hypothetical protein